MEYTQKQYSALLGGVTQMDKSTRLDSVWSGDAGQFVAWLCVEQIVLWLLHYTFTSHCEKCHIISHQSSSSSRIRDEEQ
jgi:hypothetical protein